MNSTQYITITKSSRAAVGEAAREITYYLEQYQNQHSNQIFLRAFARSLGALYETVTSFACSRVIASTQIIEDFCEQELDQATEKREVAHQIFGFPLKPNIRSKIAKEYPDLLPNEQSSNSYDKTSSRIKIGIRMMFKNQKLTEPNFNCSGWQDLLKSIEIRDRVMHPKVEADLFIDSKDSLSLLKAARWYSTTIVSGSQISRAWTDLASTIVMDALKQARVDEA